MMSFFPFLNMLSQKGLRLFVCVFVSSCITYVYPKGAWSEPLDLGLHNASLKGIIVKVTCTHDGSKLQALGSSAGGACTLIQRSIKSLGATVLDLADGSNPETDGEAEVAIKEKGQRQTVQDGTKQDGGAETLSEDIVPDVLVSYQGAASHSGRCGWSWIPMLVTGGVYPCLAETNAQATLTISAVRNHWRSSSPLEFTVRKYFGVAALHLLVRDMGKPLSRSAYELQVSNNFVTFVQSKVYTAAMMEGGAF